MKRTVATLVFWAFIAVHPSAQAAPKPHNIILMIPDGCGFAHQTLARIFKGAPLAYDSLTPGICRTHSANSLITGSAAAATAFATGYKTWEQDGAVKCLGMLADSTVFPSPRKLPPDMQWRPVASVLEAARLKGMSTGLIATSQISHATPAGFSSHWHDRDNDLVIAKQQVYQNIDVVFGGGMRNLLPTDVGGRRTDGENLVDVLKSRGYSVISTQSDLASLPSTTTKVWGLFAPGHLSADLNRQYFGREEPSLAEMTEKAISLLSRSPKGFFLMVEGSQVDWASHGNDAIGVVTEFMAFDAAVKVAVDFARRNGSTTLMVFPDHDNGGLSVGKLGTAYTDLKKEDLLPVLKGARMTVDGFLDTLARSARIGPVDFASTANALNSFLGISNLSPEDSVDVQLRLTALTQGKTTEASRSSIGRIIDRRAHVGWTTFGHTGNDVWIYGLGVEFGRTIDNTDIAEICFGKLGMTREFVNRSLFQDASALLASLGGAKIDIDSSGVSRGLGSMKVTLPKGSAVFPFFKNEVHLDGGKIVTMPGLTIYSQKSGKVFVPSKSLQLLAGGK